ncbi:MAG TPA: T9SS type A sorting domain-containing protein [Caldithrix abyssi]|uniref:chitinase n=1 Tax=Caldithrix abyssi TaxID=187145 RepID=A0A7V4WVH1_CALAY|nr:T9SS type A sorting domain-containing protein [Caldithrix abyssi]
MMASQIKSIDYQKYQPLKKQIFFKRFILSVCAILLLFINVYAHFTIIGYYPYWESAAYPPSEIKYEYVTHINHAFAWPDAEGHLVVPSGLVNAQLLELAHNNNVKVLIALGGWSDSDGFSPMAADSLKRARFIDELVDFIRTNGYDGADFDWEFPQSEKDRANLTKLIKEVRLRFDAENPEWLLTMAVSVGDYYGQWFDFDLLKEQVDWFNAMCYDFHGSWSAHSGHNAPLYQPPGDVCGSVDTGMRYLNVIRRIPKKRLTVGIPFYGKQFNSGGLYQSFSGEVSDLFYYQIAPLLDNSDWEYFWDEAAKVPYLQNSAKTKLITFDDTLSVGLKSRWIKENAFAGAMIWALGQDEYNHKQLLLQTIARQLLDSISTVIKKAEIIPQNHIIYKNYPNPFNPVTTISFYLPFSARVNITVYDTRARRIRQLLHRQKVAGKYDVTFNAAGLASGIYFYILAVYPQNAAARFYSGKMLLIE